MILQTKDFRIVLKNLIHRCSCICIQFDDSSEYTNNFTIKNLTISLAKQSGLKMFSKSISAIKLIKISFVILAVKRKTLSLQNWRKVSKETLD